MNFFSLSSVQLTLLLYVPLLTVILPGAVKPFIAIAENMLLTVNALLSAFFSPRITSAPSITLIPYMPQFDRLPTLALIVPLVMVSLPFTPCTLMIGRASYQLFSSVTASCGQLMVAPLMFAVPSILNIWPPIVVYSPPTIVNVPWERMVQFFSATLFVILTSVSVTLAVAGIMML